METIPISFSELRRSAEKVLNFLDSECGVRSDNYFGKGIEEDLGITGDDAFEMLEKFSEKYKVDFEGFNFLQYFSPEGIGIEALITIPVTFILLIFLIIKISIAGVIYIFNKDLGKNIYQFSIAKRFQIWERKFFPRKLKNLTIADLITSLVKGKFTERQTVKFVIVK